MADAGFLVDPETEFGRHLQPNALALDRLDEAPCLVLLGEPGIGKSTSVAQERERLIARGQTVVLIDLSRVNTGPAIAAALAPIRSAASVVVILDGVDEGIARNPSFADDLAGVLEGVDPGHVRLRLTSRTLEWPPTLEKRLQERWGRDVVRVYELLPLRRADVMRAAADHGLDGAAFVECLQERDATSLAVRPISLRFLLEMYSVDGTLPHSKARLFDEGSLILCSEEGAWQRGRSHGNADVFRRRAIAARIAALSTFTNRQAIDRSASGNGDELPVQAVIGGAETIAGATYAVDSSAVEDVLNGTAMFTARSATTFGWSHQSYREFLAAWYLAQHNIKAETAKALYFPLGDGSRVPGPLREVAAWHAGFVPRVFDLLVERDPEVLLHSDSAAVSPEARAQLTEALLRRMATFEALDGSYWRRDYEKLKHPNLAEQLRPYIRDHAANIVVRRASMDIAWACGVNEVVDDLVEVLRDPEEDLHARECAARALGQLGGDRVRQVAREELAAGIPSDPNDSIRGSLLDFLWPEHLKGAELFRALTVPQRSDYTGSYQRFIDGVPATLQPEDLPSALEWAERIGGRASYHLERAQQRIVDRALPYVDRPEVLAVLVRIVRSSIKSHLGPWGSRRSSRDRQQAEITTAQRRAITAELIRLGHADERLVADLVYSRPPLLVVEDVAWLANQADGASGEVAQALGKCVAHLYARFGYPTEPTTADAVASVESKSFRAQLGMLLDPIVLDSERAEKLRAEWNRPAQLDADDDEPEVIEPSRWSVAGPHLQRFEAGDLTAWISFIHEWTNRASEPIQDVSEWVGLQASDHDRILAAAVRFLNHGEAPDPNWLDKNEGFPWSGIAGRVALQLLSAVRPSLFEEVSGDAWRRWCPVVVGVPFPESDGLQRDLCQRCVAIAPVEFTAAIIRIARQENRQNGSVFVFREVPLPLDSTLQAAVLGLLDELGDQGFENALEILAESGNAQGIERGVAAMVDAPPNRAARAARVVLLRDGSQWTATITRMKAEREFAEVFASLVSRDEDQETSPLGSLTEDLTAQLFLTVFRLYPPERDTRLNGILATGDHLSRFRERLIRKLVAFGTDAGVAALEWLIVQEPERDVLRWHLVSAKERQGDAGWAPISVPAFWDAVGVSVLAVVLETVVAPEYTVSVRKEASAAKVAQLINAQVPGVSAKVSGHWIVVGAQPDAVASLQGAAERTPALRDAILGIQIADEWIFEAVPPIIPNPRPTRDAPAAEVQAILSNVHVLVETATDVETNAVLASMENLPGHNALVVGSVDIATYTIGTIGRYAVAHFQSDIGPEGANGAPLATNDAIRDVSPKVVLLVGIAFGMSRVKQRLGDVLAAQYVTSYEMVKLKPETIEERGATLSANVVLCERIKSHKRSWHFLRADGSQVDVAVGQVLSGAKLVDSRVFRDSLSVRFPSALGGEMEGIGAYAAASRKNVPVLLVKGICDWADGLKNARAQPFAAAAAASMVGHVLSKPDALKALGVPSVDESPVATPSSVPPRVASHAVSGGELGPAPNAIRPTVLEAASRTNSIAAAANVARASALSLSTEVQRVLDAALKLVLEAGQGNLRILGREIRFELGADDAVAHAVADCVAARVLERLSHETETYMFTPLGLLSTTNERPRALVDSTMAMLRDLYRGPGGRRLREFTWRQLRAAANDITHHDFHLLQVCFYAFELAEPAHMNVNDAEMQKESFDPRFQLRTVVDLEQLSSLATADELALRIVNARSTRSLAGLAPRRFPRSGVKPDNSSNANDARAEQSEQVRRGNVAKIDDQSLAVRREILETLYELLKKKPGATGIWNADPSDERQTLRAREAEYLREKGLVTGMIGADGGVAVRLTATGRDYVEAGGFWGTGTAAAPIVDADTDRKFARLAIEEAKKSKAEDDRSHPMVGAVVVRDGQVIAKAHRGELGAGDHGEYTLLEKKLADDSLVGATVYVTLEPCTTRNHPKICCADRLLERKVARVVIGMVDPDPRITGRGILKLRGGRVDIAFFAEDLASAVEELNRHWIRSIKESTASAVQSLVAVPAPVSAESTPPIIVAPSPVPARTLAPLPAVVGFETNRSSMIVARQKSLVGTAVQPAMWKLVATPSPATESTRAELYTALTESTVSSDGGTQRRTRWPAVLRPQAAQSERTDGATVWRLISNTGVDNVLDEEQLGQRSDGSIWFQRSVFWDQENIHVDVGAMAFDVVVFVMLAARYLCRLGGAGEIEFHLAFSPPRNDVRATFGRGHRATATQPSRTPVLRGSPGTLGKKVKASIAMESAGYVTTTKRLLDGVANEFELEADPFFGGTRGPSFLELDAESLKAIVESLE